LEEQRNRFREALGSVFLAVLLLILCFPRLEPYIDIGVDPPLQWAYSYFFVHGIQAGVDVVFTHGPLAFLIQPVALGNNFGLALILTSLIYFLFFYGFLQLGRHLHKGKWLLTTVILLIIGHLVPLVYLLTGLTVTGILLFHEKKSIAWLIISCFSAVFGFYIKTAYGFLALCPIFTYAVLYLLRYRKYKIPLVCIAGPAIAFVIIWVAIYSNFRGIGTFAYATYELAKGNSTGCALYPENNWTLLSLAIICLLAIPFFIKQRRVYLVFALFALSLFGTWKHGFSREDASHVKGSIVFIILALSFVLIYLRNARPLHLALLSLPPVLLYMNILSFVEQPQPYTIESMQFINFYNQVFHRDAYIKSFQPVSQRNLQGNRLDEETRRLIGDSTVDVYPFDFSFIPANGLKWKPRPVLQTYVTYSTWLDERNAAHFDSGKGPEFILWHLTGDMHGQLTDMDSRYVLNDEPAGIMSVLKNYRFVHKTNRVMLFQHTAKPLIGPAKEIKRQEGQWEEWMDVPEINDEILRVKMNAKGSVRRALKSFFYKDGAFFVEYRLANNEIRKFRILLSNAEDGVWVNPLITNVSDSTREQPVTQIRFFASDRRLMEEKFELIWEQFPILNALPDSVPYRNAFGLFGEIHEPPAPIFESKNEFDASAAGWSASDSKALVKDPEKGSMAYRLDTNLFSPSYILPLDTFSVKDSIFSVYASVKCRLPHKSKAKLVVSVTDSAGTLLWEGTPMDYFVNEFERWEYVYAQHNLPANLPPSAKLFVSVWNVGPKPILIDDLEVKLYKKPKSR
jgi:hypothetical protein